MDNKSILKNIIDEIEDENFILQLIQEAKNQELSKNIHKIASIISYELGSPLNSLKSISELLLLDMNDENYDRKLLRQTLMYLSSQIEILHNKMGNVIEWCNLENENYIFNQEHVDLLPLINYVINLFKIPAHNKGIEIEIQCEKDLCVIAHKDMLFVILQNLISNALKYSKKKDKITISVVPKDQHLEIRIKDTGIGMGQAKIKKIYDIERPVQRGTANEQGLGLGLIVVNKMLSLHEEALKIDSKRGVGSVFSFRLKSAKEFLRIEPMSRE